MFGNGKPVWLPVSVVSFEADGKSAIFSMEWDVSIKIKAPLKDSVLREKDENTDDLSKLKSVNEAAVLNQLCQRFVSNAFVTAIGRSSYVALNPIHRIVRHLGGHRNDTAEIYSYLDRNAKQSSVYHAADKAYRTVVEDLLSQTIILRGCCGAGKTETLKHIAQYLLVADAPSRITREHEFPTYEPLGTVHNPILNVDTPIAKGVAAWLAVLDFFGSAQTEKNENSSRHAKLMKFNYGAGKD
jgi:myosin heavy subunit